MTYGLWLSTAGLQVNDYRQSIASNNLANTDTVGFKHDLAVVHERMVESAAGGNRRFAHPVLDGMTGGSWVKPTVQTFEQGDLEQTGNPTDLALQGDGFFEVSDGKEARYTRDGRMTLNAAGELVMTANGGRYRFQNEAGQSIKVDPQGGTISVGADGEIHQGDETIGKLRLATFADRTQLMKVSGNLYRNEGQTPARSQANVRGGYVERSTYDPIAGLASMIEVTRAYQLNANLITLQDQTIGQAVTAVGRLG